MVLAQLQLVKAVLPVTRTVVFVVLILPILLAPFSPSILPFPPPSFFLPFLLTSFFLANKTCSGESVCSVHGTCLPSGFCLCFGSWTGPKCDKGIIFSLFFFFTTLPSLPPFCLSSCSIHHILHFYINYIFSPPPPIPFSFLTSLLLSSENTPVTPNITNTSPGMTVSKETENQTVFFTVVVTQLREIDAAGNEVYLLDVQGKNFTLQVKEERKGVQREGGKESECSPHSLC